ncbi:acetyl-CoA carboxylase biotin carboxyl carrier protein [Granulicella mallensis]|jgi:acetyl-CoA carboxylase biotin carboxyl carrier protein|uniref:Biotin carboxyl carrier protein of acetyl-CoA carboxylase n=1 Tax=Granulicella mallensis TaxID=940614 RepID=A0A7W7ZSW5_9BACT|nr:acetyl-CoA carboxylase biotin carboxyl carrier protein [Granulicella mallensis]MBB5065542.1 acetyl-CoA carboxylase biotin carboxyl carrier protein [Granulicella mallensis]
MDGNDLKELRELVEFLKASGVEEFEMERPDLKVGLKFAGETPVAAATPAGFDMAQLAALMAAQRGSAPAPAAVAAPAASAPAAVVPAAEVDPHAGAHIVKSPIVGTFYDAPSPDAEVFVKVGDQVEAGKVLCIVEAMKLMNEIESDAAGEIVKVLVKPGQPVEYGQPLFAIKAR